MRLPMSRTLLALLTLVGGVALAEPQFTLRLGSEVPEGTAWAREGHAFSRDVEALTGGRVRLKWYLSGIAGDELQMADRIRRDQLDGVGSGGMLCNRLAPSLRITRLIGLFRTRGEVNYVLGLLKPFLDEEFTHSGYENLFETLLGPDLPFTRTPVRNLADLKRVRLWFWNLDEPFAAGLRALGMSTVPLPLEQAARAYEEGRTDGFIAIPLAALAFQWSAQVKYIADLPLGFLTGCFIVSHRAFDALPIELQGHVRAAAAKFYKRLEVVGAEQDQVLLKGGFSRQGITSVTVSDADRRAYLEQAKQVRDAMGDQVVPAALRKKVDGLLDQYRSEHAAR
jgi:TRAP-type C4-dicarboxylate transport system substrate-binding protein